MRVPKVAEMFFLSCDSYAFYFLQIFNLICACQAHKPFAYKINLGVRLIRSLYAMNTMMFIAWSHQSIYYVFDYYVS